tara:strand:+ start:106 stop:1005 length:900 start_codon:yes stop_codon:yes gene_type:complete
MNHILIKLLNKLKSEKKKNFQLSLKKLSKLDKTKIINFAYDLQTGSYIRDWEKKKQAYRSFNEEIVEVINDNFRKLSNLLDCGCGELTNTNLLRKGIKNIKIYGLDFSFNRILAGVKYFKLKKKDMNFVCATLKDIPFKNNSFEISMTMHAIEPNNGEEEEIIKELIRVSSRGLVLIEPDYKLANTIQRKRMRKYGYTQNLEKILIKKNIKYKKIPMKNYLSFKNKSSIYIINLNKKKIKSPIIVEPITKKPISLINSNYIYSKTVGLIYPVIEGIPILKKEFAMLLPNNKIKKNVLLK